MFKRLVTVVLASSFLIGASAGIASAKAEQWSHVKPAAEQWS